MNVTLVLRAIIICAKITSTWPSNFDLNFFVRIFKDFQWFLSLLNAIGLFIPLLLGVHHYRNESIKLMKVLSETTALTIILFNLILCKWQENHLRVSNFIFKNKIIFSYNLLCLLVCYLIY